MDEIYEYETCKNCIYFRIDDESGDGYCKRTYAWTTSESSCDCFMSLNEL